MSFIGKIQQALAAVAPYFIQEKNIGRFLQAVSVALDTSNEELAMGLRLNQPLRCDESALPVISRDRVLRIYDTEPITSRRYRLSRYLQLKRAFGTHLGQMMNVQPFFLDRPALPRMRIVFQSGSGNSASWWTLESDGTRRLHKATPSNFNYDGQTVKRTRYWLIVYTDQLELPAPNLWGGSTWGGTIWGESLLFAQITDIINAIKEADHPAMVLWGVILATDPDSFDPTSTAVTDVDGWTSLPTGNWGWAIDSTTGQPTRLPGALVVYDRGPDGATPP